MWKKIKDAAAKAWALVKKGLKQIAALFTDHEWNLDIYRIGGVAAYIIAGLIALRVSELLPTLDAARLGIGAGLASFVGGLGTTLFGQARKADAAILAQPSGSSSI
jgi:hypothetical protein